MRAVLEDRPLARRLFAEVDIDSPIGEALFEPVARIYASLYQDQKIRDGQIKARVEVHA
jgi:flagellar biosynthesis protein FlhB